MITQKQIDNADSSHQKSKLDLHLEAMRKIEYGRNTQYFPMSADKKIELYLGRR